MNLGLLARQVLLVGVGLGVLWTTSLGLSLLLPITVVGLTVGAWSWAVQQSPGSIDRAGFRRASKRSGLAWGAAVAAVYGVLASVPGQVELTGLGLVIAALAIGGMGGLAAMGLTLCGLDAGHTLTTEPREPR